MNGIQKVVDELEAFEQSIRHLPLAERKVQIKREYERRMKTIEHTRKIILAGAVGLVPALNGVAHAFTTIPFWKTLDRFWGCLCCRQSQCWRWSFFQKIT